MGEGRIPNSPAVMSKREKRKSERKSINDCRTEFRITRNVSDPEIEGKQSSRDQVSELSEHEKLYNFKKALIDDKQDQWIKFECERKYQSSIRDSELLRPSTLQELAQVG